MSVTEEDVDAIKAALDRYLYSSGPPVRLEDIIPLLVGNSGDGRNTPTLLRSWSELEPCSTEPLDPAQAIEVTQWAGLSTEEMAVLQAVPSESPLEKVSQNFSFMTVSCAFTVIPFHRLNII